MPSPAGVRPASFAMASLLMECCGGWTPACMPTPHPQMLVIDQCPYLSWHFLYNIFIIGSLSFLACNGQRRICMIPSLCFSNLHSKCLSLSTCAQKREVLFTMPLGSFLKVASFIPTHKKKNKTFVLLQLALNPSACLPHLTRVDKEAVLCSIRWRGMLQ